MEHDCAIENHTAERYLLGELDDVDRGAYEEHYFSCPVCAEEIASASEFMESARSVVREDLTAQTQRQAVRQPVREKWLNWRILLLPIPAAACSLLLAVLSFAGYQNRVTIPRLAQMAAAHIIPQNTVPLALTQSRGEPVTAPAGKPLDLTFAVPRPEDSSMSFSSYRADIVTDSNLTKLSFDISLEQSRDPVRIFVQPGTLPPGKYLVVIRGVNSDGLQKGVKGELTSLPFSVMHED